MTAHAQKQTLLIIDDSPVMLRTLSRLLAPKCNVRLSKDGAEGIKLAQKYDIDLILLDISMPNLSGFEVLAELKSNEATRAIPVIFITGSDSVDDEEKGLSLGAIDYIRKPFSEVIVRLRVDLHLQLISQMRIIEQLSLTDGLTRLYNRRSFDQNLTAAWNGAVRSCGYLSLLMVDIDQFKLFNDKHGHLNGDLCLKTVSKVLKKTVKRKSDLVFRWGGEEFTVLLPETQSDGARDVAEQIRKNIAETPILLPDETVYVTVSIGVSTAFPKIEDNLEDFCVALDDALYMAKENGRNRVEVVNL